MKVTVRQAPCGRWWVETRSFSYRLTHKPTTLDLPHGAEVARDLQ